VCLQTGYELCEKEWSILKSQTQQIDIQVDCGVLQNGKDLIDIRCALLVAEAYQRLKGAVITLRIDNADLVCLVNQPLYQAGRQGRFASP
jgi:hypothetical protein